MKSNTNSVHTPAYIIDALRKEFGTDLFDPCPFDEKWNKLASVDGLTIPWEGPVVFINPPYKSPRKWFERAREVWQQGKTVILLVKAEIVGSKYFKSCS